MMQLNRKVNGAYINVYDQGSNSFCVECTAGAFL